MNIGIYHGYNLTGSGSNEYTRYLAKTFLNQGHNVQVICREYHPEKIDFIGQLWCWKTDGQFEVSVVNPALADTSVVHQIPYGEFYPVYITGKKSSTIFKEFVNLTDRELESFKSLNQMLLHEIFSRNKIDILHANHLVMQPAMAIDPCKEFDIPFIIYPHGSAIEYAVKRDPRYLLEARRAIEACRGLIIGNHEVKDRICNLFPDLQEMIINKTQIVGVGVDTKLFVPISKQKRKSAIDSFINSQIPDACEGKTPEQLEALYDALEKRDYQAIAANSEGYVQNSLDTDSEDKLLKLNFADPVLLFVGALTAGKGLQSLITALPVIFKQIPETQLVVIGAGDFREPLEALLYGLAKQRPDIVNFLSKQNIATQDDTVDELWKDVAWYLDNLSDPDEYYENAKRLLEQVKFLGRVNHQQLSYLFPCADLAVFPSVIPEAYPLVLMESLANGVLPVVSYFSGFKDGIDELNQFLDPLLVERLKISMSQHERIQQLALNIIDLLNIVRDQDMSEHLNNIAKANYDWSHRGIQMLDAYKQAIQ